MGYDFQIVRLIGGAPEFPFKPESGFEMKRIGTFTNLCGIRDALAAECGFRPYRHLTGHVSQIWETPDGGSLSISLDSEADAISLYIDTHARWCFVLEVLSCVKKTYPDAVLVDPQTVLLYDETSFREFIQSNMRAK